MAEIKQIQVNGSLYDIHAKTVEQTTIPSGHCTTAAATAAKTADWTYYTATANRYLQINLRYANSAKSALTLNINSTGAKSIYINGVASSSTNYTLPAGPYIIYYDGTNYYFRTDGTIPTSTGAAGNLEPIVVSYYTTSEIDTLFNEAT